MQIQPYLFLDGRCEEALEGRPSFEGFSLSLIASDRAEAERLFAALADGGDVRQPLIETFFSPRYGMLAERFGVPWLIVAATKESR